MSCMRGDRWQELCKWTCMCWSKCQSGVDSLCFLVKKVGIFEFLDAISSPSNICWCCWNTSLFLCVLWFLLCLSWLPTARYYLDLSIFSQICLSLFVSSRTFFSPFTSSLQVFICMVFLGHFLLGWEKDCEGNLKISGVAVNFTHFG